MSRRLVLNAAGTLRAALARAAAAHQQPAAAAAASSAAPAAPTLAASASAPAATTLLPSLARPFASSSSSSAAAAAADEPPAAQPPSLLAVLKREIKHERSAYSAPAVVASGPPAPFTLVDVPGEAAVSLRREFRGGETITVDCSVNLQDALGPPPGFEDDLDDEDEEEGEGEGAAKGEGRAKGEGEEGDDDDDDEGEDDEDPGDVAFNVTVTKGGASGPSLVFECVSDGTYVDVRHVALESKPAAAGGGAAAAASPADDDAAYSGPVFDELDEELQDAFRAYLEARGVDEDLGEYLRWLLVDKEQREYTAWLDGVRRFVE